MGSKVGTTQHKHSGEVVKVEDKEEEEREEERNDILIVKEEVFTRGVLHEETPLPRKRERRGKSEKSGEMMRTFIFGKNKEGMSEIALRFPCIFG